MKFALLGPVHPWRGGIAHYTGGLYKALSPQHNVQVYTFRRQYPGWLFPGGDQRDSSQLSLEVPAHMVLDSLSPRSWLQTARAIACQCPDAVLLQWWHPFFGPCYWAVMRALARSTEAAQILLCHNITAHEVPRFPGQGWLERFLVRGVLSRADGCLVQARHLLEHVSSLNSELPVQLIQHPAYDHFHGLSPEAVPGPNDGRLRLLFFGTIRSYKGVEVLLQALSLVNGKVDLEATIAGEFYCNSEPFFKLARRLELGSRLIWREGYVPNEEVPKLFQAADLIVLPYLRATQSGVVGLAYSFERPVLAARLSGLAESVLEGRTGYLFEPGNPKDLAEKIVQFAHNADRDQFRSHIRAFRESLGWDQVVEGILALLGRLKMGAIS